MHISYNWLSELLPVGIDLESAADKLTVIGLEVEGIENYGLIEGNLEGLVVGHVLKCEKHPNADKLSLTKVDIGEGEPVQIVCGAPNVAEGQTVVVAKVGSVLHPISGDSFKIKKAKIRGEESFGMICAEDEIGLGESHDGIMVLDGELSPGTPFSEIANVKSDKILEIGLTPNRGDATSHWGVARDLLANIRAAEQITDRMSLPTLLDLPKNNSSSWSVEIEDPEACKRYSGIIMDGIQVGPSPQWLKDRLNSLGMNSVNNVVDITNYVMLELGQPLHAFDASKVAQQKIKVGYVSDRTKFLALDGEEYTLRQSDLMIKDGNDTPMCIAGVFGGKNAETNLETSSIFLEAAFFDPKKVRSTSLHHQLRTNSATVFEKQSDPEMCWTALSRAAYLIQEIIGGKVGDVAIDHYPQPVAPSRINLRHARVNSILGIEITRELIENILDALEIKILDQDQDSWNIEVPAYRGDVTREIDVVEEIIRIYGLDNIVIPKQLRSSILHSSGSNKHLIRRNIAQRLSGLGFSEIMNVSLTMDKFYPDRKDLIFIENTSNVTLNVMRPELIHPALNAVAYNLNRQQNSLKFYEFGRSYQRHGNEIIEKEQLLILVSGDRYKSSWISSDDKMNEHDLTGLCTALLKNVGITNYEQQNDDAYFKRGFRFVDSDTVIAEGGIIPERELEWHDIDQEVFALILDMSSIYTQNNGKKDVYQEISKYPTVERHVAIKIKDDIKFGDIQRLIAKIGGSLVSEISLIDVYKDEEMTVQKEKSYAISILFSTIERTLKDEEIDKIMTEVMENLGEEFSAVIRK